MKGGAAHALGPPQQREFGGGGGGLGTIELPITASLGIQGNVGALALAQGDAPDDPGLARQGTGSAFFATTGVRFAPMTAVSGNKGGLWIDVNGGALTTGNVMRPVVDTHVGWAFRASSESRLEVGPFVGFTQIVQPDSALRDHDARIAWVGVEVSLGASPAPRSAPPPAVEARIAPPPPAPVDADGVVEATNGCPEGKPVGSDDDCIGEVRLVGDRIVLDDVIHFDFDSPRIRPRSFPLVRKIARFIRESGDIVEVRIEGHADAVGSDVYNQQLSEARAASTRQMLVELGVDDARLLPVGHGRSRLKVSTAKPDMRNRRVEFIVARKSPVRRPVTAAFHAPTTVSSFQ